MPSIPSVIRCPECNGTGEIYETCHKCRGTGVFTPSPYDSLPTPIANAMYVTCDECHGLHLPSECPRCNGKGFIPNWQNLSVTDIDEDDDNDD